MRPSLISALVLLALLPAAIAEPAQEPNLPHAEQLAKQMKIPRVSFHNATIAECAAFLHQRSLEIEPVDANPKNRGLTINTLNEQVATARVYSLGLHEVSFHHVLTSIAEHSGTAVAFGDDSIVFKPAHPVPPAPGKPAHAEPAATAVKARTIPIPSMDFEGTTLEEARDFLISRTRELDPEIDPGKKGINIRIPSEELAKRTIDELKLSNVSLHYAIMAIAEHSGITVEFGEESIVFRPANPKAKAPRAKSNKYAHTADKARTIIIPVIDFESTWLEEGIDFFRQRSRELDQDPDPNRKGLNIRIVGKELGRREIHSLKLRNTSLKHAMTIVAEMTNTTVAFENEAIVFRPANEETAKPRKFVQMPTATLTKARQIEIPTIDFDGTWLSEGIDFLRVRSRELDITAINPRNRGINIIILDKDLAKREIRTLKLRDVSLLDALKAMAKATNSTVEFGEESIVFKDKPATK